MAVLRLSVKPFETLEENSAYHVFFFSLASCIIHKFLFNRSMDSAGNEGLIAVLTLLQMLRLNDIPLPVKNVLTYDFESN